MQAICLRIKKKSSIAVVPTMGHLHDGHLALVRIAQRKASVTIVTIFVNPLQFGQNEDCQVYPRDERGDLKKLRRLGVDYVFMPKVFAMYPEGFKTTVHVEHVTKNLCGRSRPGHFDGVATVVLKLFEITRPDFAVFGKKDYQQLVTIKTMVKDLDLPVRILAAPIVREKDGLAMSSRNIYLKPAERRPALALYRGLLAVKKVCRNGHPDRQQIEKIFRNQIPKDKRIKLEYIECVNVRTLEPCKTFKRNNTLVAAAVFIGNTRLIDNVVV